jgi:hypothetical protein
MKLDTVLMVASVFLWLAMVGLSGAGLWFPALFVLLALLLVYGLLGSMHRGRFDLPLVLFPSFLWLVLWGIGFWLGNHYAELFEGGRPDFTILGFHPSFAAIIVFYWTIPTLLMGFGFAAVKDRWLSQEKWEEFLRQVKEVGDD